MRLFQIPVDSFVEVVKIEGDEFDQQEVTNDNEEFDE